MTEQTQTWRQWLMTDAPTSRGHARAAAAYNGWLRLRSNHMAMVGLFILLLLLLIAAIAPWLALQLRDQGRHLLPRHFLHIQTDMLHAGQGRQDAMDILGDAVGQGAGQGGEVEGEANVALFDLDVAHHVEIDNIALQFGIDNGAKSV